MDLKGEWQTELLLLAKCSQSLMWLSLIGIVTWLSCTKSSQRVLESGAFGAGVWEPEMAQASLARNCMTYQPGCWGGKVGLGERFRGNRQDFTGV